MTDTNISESTFVIKLTGNHNKKWCDVSYLSMIRYAGVLFSATSSTQDTRLRLSEQTTLRYQNYVIIRNVPLFDFFALFPHH